MALFSKLSNNVEVSEVLEKRPNVITENDIIETIFGSDLLEDLDMSMYLEYEKKNKIDVNEEVEGLLEDLMELEKELSILDESEILNEGKLMDKLRWKVVMFSLRFLSNNFLNDFFEEYYNDEKGNPTKESMEWVRKSRREKIKKIREFANRLPEDVKTAIINSKESKAFESKGGNDLLFTGISGLGFAGAAVGAINNVKQTRDFMQTPQYSKSVENATSILSLLAVLLSAIGGIAGVAIWTTFISAGVMTGINATKAAINYTKAITVRKEDAINIIKQFKDKTSEAEVEK